MNLLSTLPRPLAANQPISSPAAYTAWRDAIEARDIDRVLELYETDDSALWGTLAQRPLYGRDEIRTYFETFLDRTHIKVTPLETHHRGAANHIAIATGIYRFELGRRRTARPQIPSSVVRARFTFVYRQCRKTRSWLILEHHSSLFPQVGNGANGLS